MSANDAHPVVVDNVVVVLQVALHLGVSALVVCPQAVVNGPVASTVSDRAKSLGFNTFGNNAMLPRDIVGINDVHVVPRSPRDTAMVHNDVFAVVER